MCPPPTDSIDALYAFYSRAKFNGKSRDDKNKLIILLVFRRGKKKKN